jgi:hypothetical protein
MRSRILRSKKPRSQMLYFACLLVMATVSSFGQSSTKSKSTATPSKSDTWQKSKDCASQAERLVSERASKGYGRPLDWYNHYSPKYDRCFLETFNQLAGNEPGGGVLFSNSLFDAFERSPIAYWYETHCVGACSETINIMVKASPCSIEKEPTSCEEVKTFIAEHMKN